jgi:hypothetical protein
MDLFFLYGPVLVIVANSLEEFAFCKSFIRLTVSTHILAPMRIKMPPQTKEISKWPLADPILLNSRPFGHPDDDLWTRSIKPLPC